MLVIFLVLAGCGGSGAGKSPAQAVPGVPDAAAGLTPEEQVAGPAADCGALAPLLRVLPATKAINGLPERHRSCEPAEYAVIVSYHDDGEHASEYKFRVQLMRGDSPYSEGAVNPPGATDEQRAFMREAITRIGDMLQTQWGLCRNYATNPSISEGRNPTLATIKGVEVCFSDNLDADKAVWHAKAVQNNLSFELELSGAKAAAMRTTAEAQAHLAPLFADFLLDDAAQ